jgi:asparagine synthase (glutamine-hydrolysing)
MRSAFPVACLLSGGLDSSSIASIASKKLQWAGSRLIGLSGVLPENYKGPETDERYYIDQVRDKWNINMSYVTPSGNGIYDQAEQTCRRLENPFIDTRHYQHKALQDAAEEKGARVILDGYGGEVTASGYAQGYFAELALRGRWLLLSKELKARSNIENQTIWALVRGQVIRPFAPAWIEWQYYRLLHHMNISESNSAIQSKFADKMKTESQLKIIGKIFKTYPSVRKNEIKAYHMNCSQTARMIDPANSTMLYPYLDKRLLDFYFSIPTRLKAKNGWKRYLIRTGMETMLPKEIQWRTTKQLFSPDHPRRLKAAEDEARTIIDDVREDDPIRKFIDVSGLTRRLELLRKETAMSDKNAYSLSGNASIVQRGIYAIVFSRVFSQIF